RGRPDAPNAAVPAPAAPAAAAGRRRSSGLPRNLRSDGLLHKTPAEPAPAAAPRADFDGLAGQVRTRVLGQDAFVADVVKAFRRPFVMGRPAGAGARGLMLLCGPAGTGRHYTLRCVV